MQRTTIAVVLTALLTVTSVGGAMALGAPAGDIAPQSDQPQAAQQQAAQQQSSCDYQSLFDQSIGSVVSVQTASGQGSGFVYQVANATGGANATDTANATDGANATGETYIVTNAHVVSGADTVEIQFEAGEYRTGEVVGRSTYADLAVVSVDDAPDYVEGLEVAATDPDHGEKVAALGNPLGLEETITHGIVSGVNRSLPTDRGFSIPNVIQTDAPISPGNSGGPLVACDGTVVGVNTAGISSQRAENIGFAVSASVIERVVPELLAEGEFEYPYLGVQTTPVTPAVAEANDINRSGGIMVVSTVEGGPASGVLQGATGAEVRNGQQIPIGGDVILSVNGTQIETGEDLGTYLVLNTEPGETVNMTVLRDGEVQQIDVTIGERPEPQGT
ncbi:S1C family serine protease [Halosimplex aquaticum]|uniref:S1C family serine protease n=1 Tax=Halosimplex aquaticum TaxID=3026162 RepID=A0ABD5Y5R5_9EURY|nr:trypsin-like peptidase domain-containing protein [Halosimplex aquaticum]